MICRQSNELPRFETRLTCRSNIDIKLPAADLATILLLVASSKNWFYPLFSADSGQTNLTSRIENSDRCVSAHLIFDIHRLPVFHIYDKRRSQIGFGGLIPKLKLENNENCELLLDRSMIVQPGTGVLVISFAPCTVYCTGFEPAFQRSCFHGYVWHFLIP